MSPFYFYRDDNALDKIVDHVTNLAEGPPVPCKACAKRRKKKNNPYKTTRNALMVIGYFMIPLAILGLIAGYVYGVLHASSIGAFEQVEVVSYESRDQGWVAFNVVGGFVSVCLLAGLWFWAKSVWRQLEDRADKADRRTED